MTAIKKHKPFKKNQMWLDLLTRVLYSDVTNKIAHIDWLH